MPATSGNNEGYETDNHHGVKHMMTQRLQQMPEG